MRAAQPLVGRDDEMGELLAGLEDARRGRGRVFLLGGEAGIGKTRLVETLVDAMEPTEARVLWGRCWEGGGTPPFWPFVQVLRSLITGRAETLHEVLGTAAADIATMVPELTRVLPSVRPRAPSDAPDARLRLFDAVTRALAAAAAEAGGLVVALDDLHAADEPSLVLLRHMAGEVARTHLFVVGTYRDAEARASPRLYRLLTDIGAADRRIELSGLDEQAAATLFEVESGQVVTRRLVEEVYQATGGNPLFVKEVARLLSMPSAVGGAGPHVKVPLPEELRHILRQRLATLPADVRAVLASASVLGREFELPRLARLVGHDELGLLDVLEVAGAAGVIREVAVGRWAFSHALFRESLYEQLSSHDRAIGHRRAAEALEGLAGADGAERLAELAHHWYESVDLGDAEKALRYLDRAARRAGAGMAFEEAAALWSRALDCVARSSPVDEVRRAEILTALTEARQRSGDYPAARDAYHAALKAARAAAVPGLFPRAAVSLPSNVYGRVDSARLDAMEEASRGLSGVDEATRSLVMTELAAAVNMRARAEEHASWKHGWLGWQHSEQRSRELLDASLRLAREPDASADVLMRWVIVANVFDPPLGDASVADEVVRRFAEVGDADGEARARFYVIRRHLLEGRIGPMRLELDGFERQANVLRLPHLIASATSARAALALLEGRLDDAEALARKAYDLGQQSGMQEAEIHFQRRSEVILWLRGRFAELEVVARRKARHLPEAMKVECSRVALAAALAGRPETMDEGRALFRDMVPGGLDPDVFGATRSCCLVGLADVCWALEDADGAAALYDVLVPFRGRVAVQGISTPRGATDRSLGQLATLLGRYEDAERHFEEGHRWHRAMGASVWLGLGLADHAVMLALRGRAGGDTGTRRLLSDALDVFTELGLEFHQRRIRSMLQQLGGGSCASAPDRSTIVRHGDSWTVVHEGRQTRLRDSKGVRYLAELLTQPGRRFHSLELLADTPEEASVPGVGAPAPVDAERARQSVTKALRSTMVRISAADQSLGDHLAATVRTGMFLVYDPDPRAPTVWVHDRDLRSHGSR